MINKLVPPIVGEDYDEHYGPLQFPISFKDKVILDLGAWQGDTSEYFLLMGAKSIIAVEGSAGLGAPILVKGAEKLKSNYEVLVYVSQILGNITPINLTIINPQQIEELISKYHPDLVKCDIENAEKNLFLIKDEIWKSVLEYIVECHAPNLQEEMRQKCLKNDYKILKELPKFNHVIYAVSPNFK